MACKQQLEVGTLTDAIRRLMLVQTTSPNEISVQEHDLQEFVWRIAQYNKPVQTPAALE